MSVSAKTKQYIIDNGLQLRLDGKTFLEVGEILGYSRETVRISLLGLCKSDRELIQHKDINGDPIKMSRGFVRIADAAIKLKSENRTVTEIADKFNISPSAVVTILRTMKYWKKHVRPKKPVKKPKKLKKPVSNYQSGGEWAKIAKMVGRNGII